MDLPLIQSAVSSLKVASDIAQGFLKLNSVAEVQGKVIDLQSAILSAQSSALAATAQQMELLEEVRDLKAQLEAVKGWEATSQRYELRRLDSGVFAYALREPKSDEPAHWLCPRCFADGKKSILQNRGDFYGASEHECLGCGAKIKLPSTLSPDA